MSAEIDERFPEKPSLRNVQTAKFGIPKDMQYKVLQDISRAHVESFNFILKEGLRSMILSIPPLEMALPNGDRLKVEFRGCQIGMPTIKRNTKARTHKVYPAECRTRCTTYKGACVVTVSWSLNGDVQEVKEVNFGEIPVMVKSEACNLNKLNPKELVKVGEEENEFGGYFIINGLEKLVRLLIMQRRNYPLAMQRNYWKKSGELFTDYGVSIRCVRSDQSGAVMELHYLSNGTVKLMFKYKKDSYYVPVMLILKALIDTTDFYIYSQLVKTKEKDTFYKGCITNMLRQINLEGIVFNEQALNYLGEKFSVRFNLPPWYTPIDVAKFLIKQCICIHLDNNKDKFNLIVFMIKKLFSAVKNECALESPDNPMNQEILLPGHLYLLVLKEKLYACLNSIRVQVDLQLKSAKSSILNRIVMGKCIDRAKGLVRGMENVLATGNFEPRFESSLKQNSGLAIVADKLNFWRYVSHFRAVHRGAFFAQMRTTEVRKLLPEAWGFLCPVHTPDGAPCGLLNHMTSTCQVTNIQPKINGLFKTLCKYGVLPYDDPSTNDCYTVIVDGKVVGWLHKQRAHDVVLKMRRLKCSGEEDVPKTLEMCLIPETDHASQYPGLFIFTNPARMIRPVINLLTGVNEFIGTMEQVYLHIALNNKNVIHGVTFHQELSPTSILSVLGNQIPYSDFNQSPRNMYECQMGKQTMGTPCLAIKHRSDNKLYRILTPQSPIVRPKMHDHYHMDDYPLGTNAVVAVISYTGFDMEDAIVLNKSSVERGFKHGTIYKTQVVNLRIIAGDKGQQSTLRFERKSDDEKLAKFVDVDGLPYLGTRLTKGDPFYSYVDTSTGDAVCVNYKAEEEAYVDDVALLGNDSGTDINQQVSIKLRVPRNPSIGDKFASRHGQKGICSLLLPQEDMPFTEGGMTPDIIFNPHGFPSRMTIGMMIESMAGKSAAVEGVLHDATPFQYTESDTAISYFGECLKNAGYDYYGTERMYSGVDGRELEANIFFGVVYYQRLRHMVADKYQVRTTGLVDPLTRQPVKGRKRGGGIRFGEMERDSLIAHGTSFLLHDRLFNCSDGAQQHACTQCGNLLSPVLEKIEADDEETRKYMSPDWYCTVCSTSKYITKIELPYVFRYLCAELSAMRIKLKLKIEDYSV